MFDPAPVRVRATGVRIAARSRHHDGTVRSSRSQGELPPDGGGDPSFLEEPPYLREVPRDPGRRRAVRLLRRSAVCHRPAALRPPARRHDQGHRAALPDDARPLRRAPLRLGLPRAARRVRDGAGARASAASATSRRWAWTCSTRRAAASCCATPRSGAQIVTRMGRWVDFDNDYKTMDPAYMESIWWVFKSLWDKGLIYEGHKILPYCPRCATPLSNFETNQGYEDVTDPADHRPVRASTGEPPTYILAWTTTPWTLPSNLALAVGARSRLRSRCATATTPTSWPRRGCAAYYRERGRLPRSSSEAARREAGRAALRAALPVLRRSRRRGGVPRVRPPISCRPRTARASCTSRPDSARTTTRSARPRDLPVVCPVDDEGRFTDEVSDYAGREVKEADADIIGRLKDEGKLVHRGTIRHSYPHCWRCDTPLIYRAISTWFVQVEEIGTGCWRPTRGFAGCRSTCATAASASGWRARATGPSRATATGARRCRSGGARTGEKRLRRLRRGAGGACGRSR